MKSGPQIPPAVAIAIVVVVVLIAGVLIYRGTGKKTMSASDNEKMKQMMMERGFTVFDSSGKKISGGPGAAASSAGMPK